MLIMGLKSYYKCDEGTGTAVADSIGGLNLSSFGSPTWGTGKKSNCVSVGGASPLSGYGVAGHYYKSFSIGFWWKPASIAGRYLCKNGNSTNNWACYGDPPGCHWIVYLTTGSIDISAAASAGTMYYIVCQWDNELRKAQLWVNGSLTASATQGFQISAASDSNFNFGNQYGFNCIAGTLIDEVGIWNRILTAGEVVALYNGGTGNFYDNLRPGTFDIDPPSQTSILIGSGSGTGSAVTVRI